MRLFYLIFSNFFSRLVYGISLSDIAPSEVDIEVFVLYEPKCVDASQLDQIVGSTSSIKHSFHSAKFGIANLENLSDFQKDKAIKKATQGYFTKYDEVQDTRNLLQVIAIFSDEDLPSSFAENSKDLVDHDVIVLWVSPNNSNSRFTNLRQWYNGIVLIPEVSKKANLGLVLSHTIFDIVKSHDKNSNRSLLAIDQENQPLDPGIISVSVISAGFGAVAIILAATVIFSKEENNSFFE
eukprot:GHVP01022841.1.p1 GENE.GHVP01022841.1~~GHVP01022841.1.p1  ORF type:complete len:238 (-),score=42.18 GHVP01022841.1:140-853(-)